MHAANMKGNSGVGMVSADFKNTMKHNSSNQSIQSKKMVSTIKKPSDLLPNPTSQFISGESKGFQGSGKKNSGSNYMSPYSQKMIVKAKNIT